MGSLASRVQYLYFNSKIIVRQIYWQWERVASVKYTIINTINTVRKISRVVQQRAVMALEGQCVHTSTMLLAKSRKIKV